LSALLTSDEAITPFAHEIVASRINRSEAWVGSFVSAFDEWPVANEQVFGPANYEEDFNDRSRGYRAGWYCAQRLAAALSIGSKYAVRPFVAPVGLGIPVASELNLAWFPA
jgi:hypothetical protein